MDFTTYLSDDLIRDYILQLDRNTHSLMICKSVNKSLKIIVDEILKSLVFSKSVSSTKTINSIMEQISLGYRLMCLTINNSTTANTTTTYHYVVNCKYRCPYNYHVEGQYAGECLKLVFYDGIILHLLKYDEDANITIKIDSSVSCIYNIYNIHEHCDIVDLDAYLILESPIANYEKKRLVF